ncbi:unnamed protein product, partial [Trichogramma brassicae]
MLPGVNQQQQQQQHAQVADAAHAPAGLNGQFRNITPASPALKALNSQTPALRGLQPQSPALRSLQPQSPAFKGLQPQSPVFKGFKPQSPALKGLKPISPAVPLLRNAAVNSRISSPALSLHSDQSRSPVESPIKPPTIVAGLSNHVSSVPKLDQQSGQNHLSEAVPRTHSSNKRLRKEDSFDSADLASNKKLRHNGDSSKSQMDTSTELHNRGDCEAKHIVAAHRSLIYIVLPIVAITWEFTHFHLRSYLYQKGLRTLSLQSVILFKQQWPWMIPCLEVVRLKLCQKGPIVQECHRLNRAPRGARGYRGAARGVTRGSAYFGYRPTRRPRKYYHQQHHLSKSSTSQPGLLTSKDLMTINRGSDVKSLIGTEQPASQSQRRKRKINNDEECRSKRVKEGDSNSSSLEDDPE